VRKNPLSAASEIPRTALKSYILTPVTASNRVAAIYGRFGSLCLEEEVCPIWLVRSLMFFNVVGARPKQITEFLQFVKNISVAISCDFSCYFVAILLQFSQLYQMARG
jgi:hypothetical protein